MVGDYFRETGELKIQIPAIPRPTLEELQRKYSWIKAIEFDNSPTEPVTLVLGTVFRSDENSINGREYEYRLRSVEGKFGYQQGLYLAKNQLVYPNFQKMRGKIYIDLPGLMVLNDGDSRRFPCLDGHGLLWVLRWPWIDSNFSSYHRVGHSGKESRS